jgi:hypothetical protein
VASPQPAKSEGVQHAELPVLAEQSMPQSNAPSHHWMLLGVGQQPA